MNRSSSRSYYAAQGAAQRTAHAVAMSHHAVAQNSSASWIRMAVSTVMLGIVLGALAAHQLLRTAG